jgi:hypothetical protein
MFADVGGTLYWRLVFAWGHADEVFWSAHEKTRFGWRQSEAGIR